MKLINLLEDLIFDNYQNILYEDFKQDFKNKLVGDPQSGDKYDRISEDDFNTILRETGKFAYAAWLTKQIAQKQLFLGDVKKFSKYFKIFEKHKSTYGYGDIKQYKTSEDINNFISTSEKLINDLDTKDLHGGESNFISPSQVKKLNNFGIELIGIHDGYQVFRVPPSAKGNEDAWTAYKNTLGQCRGQKIGICTFGTTDHFDSYLSRGGGESSLFVLFNLSDPQSPYQISFEGGEFKDRENKSII